MQSSIPETPWVRDDGLDMAGLIAVREVSRHPQAFRRLDADFRQVEGEVVGREDLRPRRTVRRQDDPRYRIVAPIGVLYVEGGSYAADGKAATSRRTEPVGQPASAAATTTRQLAEMLRFMAARLLRMEDMPSLALVATALAAPSRSTAARRLRRAADGDQDHGNHLRCAGRAERLPSCA